MYPKPDRSSHKPNFTKKYENEALDIGWHEGFMSDGRPYKVEAWVESNITMLTYFFSNKEIEDYSDKMLIDHLVEEEMIKFVTDKPSYTVKTFDDPSDNTMFSVNIVIGNEDKLFAKDLVSLESYK